MNASVQSASSGRQASYYVLLVVVLFLGGVFRFFNLGAPYLSEDEAYHAVIASRWAETGSPVAPSGLSYTRGMPLIVLETLALRYLPLELETAVRLPAALLGTLNIWIFFLLGKRYGGPALGLIAAAFFAVSAWSISIGTMARMYELLMTGSLFSLWSYERACETPNGKNSILLASALCLSLAAHQLGILLILLPLAGIVVHLQRPRVVVFLGAAAGAQLIFYRAYPAFLRFLIPGPAQGDGESSGAEMLASPSFGFQIVSQEILWAWLAGALILLVGAIAILKGRPRKEALYLLPWVALILGFGVAGLLVGGALTLAVFFVQSGFCRESRKTARIDRLYLTGFYAVTLFLWVLIAVAAAMSQGSFSLSIASKIFASAVRYPEVILAVIRPLLLSPRVSMAFAACMAVLALVLARIVWRGPLLPERASLTARVLFLLGAISVIGVASVQYRSDRYLYFLLPVALLSFLELMRAYWQVSKGPTRAALAVAGVLLLGLSELPGAVGQVPERDGHRRYAFGILGLPDYFGLEKQLANDRATQLLDYRAAGEFLKTRMREGDLLFVDAAHQLQAYLPNISIQGHLSPRLGEYRSGERHYFTGSALFRTPTDMIKFLQPYGKDTANRVWIALTGYDSVWQEMLPSLLDGREAWRNGGIAIYSLSAQELLTIIQCADTSGVGESGQRPPQPCSQEVGVL